MYITQILSKHNYFLMQNFVNFSVAMIDLVLSAFVLLVVSFLVQPLEVTEFVS